MLIQESDVLYHQSQSIASRYMNSFAIDENNQFEVAALQLTDKFEGDYSIEEKLNKAMKAVEKLTHLQNKGKEFLFIKKFLLS